LVEGDRGSGELSPFLEGVGRLAGEPDGDRAALLQLFERQGATAPTAVAVASAALRVAAGGFARGHCDCQQSGAGHGDGASSGGADHHGPLRFGRGKASRPPPDPAGRAAPDGSPRVVMVPGHVRKVAAQSQTAPLLAKSPAWCGAPPRAVLTIPHVPAAHTPFGNGARGTGRQDVTRPRLLSLCDLE